MALFNFLLFHKNDFLDISCNLDNLLLLIRVGATIVDEVIPTQPPHSYLPPELFN